MMMMMMMMMMSLRIHLLVSQVMFNTAADVTLSKEGVGVTNHCTGVYVVQVYMLYRCVYEIWRPCIVAQVEFSLLSGEYIS